MFFDGGNITCLRHFDLKAKDCLERGTWWFYKNSKSPYGDGKEFSLDHQFMVVSHFPAKSFYLLNPAESMNKLWIQVLFFGTEEFWWTYIELE